MSAAIQVRPAVMADADVVARMFVELWPDGTLDDHRSEAVLILAGTPPSTLPLAILVAEVDGAVVGFIEVGLRSHADGCDGRHPVGFVEGWYVEPEQRGKGVGRALMEAAEHWARSQGCREMASDTWIDNEPSQRAHEALGFGVVDRCVHFKKALDQAKKMIEVERAIPTMFVSDLDAAIAWYERVLGFRVTFRITDYAGLSLGRACIHLGRSEPPIITAAFYLQLTHGVDDLIVQRAYFPKGLELKGQPSVRIRWGAGWQWAHRVAPWASSRALSPIISRSATRSGSRCGMRSRLAGG